MSERHWTVLVPAGGPPSILETDAARPVHVTAGALVDGHIEAVNTLGLVVLGYWLIVDEEGRLKDKPVNELASYLYGQHHHGQRDQHGHRDQQLYQGETAADRSRGRSRRPAAPTQ